MAEEKSKKKGNKQKEKNKGCLLCGISEETVKRLEKAGREKRKNAKVFPGRTLP
jgi:hypothetical protein